MRKLATILPRSRALRAPVNDSPLDEVEFTVGEHFAMDAQVTPIGQRLQDGIGNGADTQLQRCPILDQLRYMPAYLPLHLVGRLLPHLVERPVPLHRIIQLGNMHEAIAVGPGTCGFARGRRPGGRPSTTSLVLSTDGTRGDAVLVWG